MAQTGAGASGGVPEENVMGHGDKRRRAALAGPVQQCAKSPADRRFDMWLEKQLHAMYEIASEPRPATSST